MRILVTRPEHDQQQTLDALAALGHEGLASPVMVVEYLPFSLPFSQSEVGLGAHWAGVIVTSRNGLRALSDDQARGLSGLPLYCVGSKTRQLAEAMGLGPVVRAAPDGASLASYMTRRAEPGPWPYLYLAGRQRTPGFEETLTARGFALDVRQVYQMNAVAHLPDGVVAALKAGQVGGVLLYSSRSARLLVKLLARHGVHNEARQCIFYCLSDKVAAVVAKGHYPLVVAAEPKEASLLASVKNGHNY